MNTSQNSGILNRQYGKDDRSKHQPSIKRNPSYEQCEPMRDKQLYQLCQHLTKDNYMLKKQNSQLKRIIQNSKGQDFFVNRNEDYRLVNYESYKKKMMQVMSSVKLLYGLYCERTKIREHNTLLDTMMLNMKKGNCNMVNELNKIFEENIKQNNQTWDIEDLIKECQGYQNQILRGHLSKMHKLLKDCIFQLKRDVKLVKDEVVYNRDKIKHEIDFYCDKYLDFGKKESHTSHSMKQSKPEIKSTSVSQISMAKMKKSGKKSKMQNQNKSWEHIASERLKVQERKKLQPNVVQKLSDSLAQQHQLNYYSVPLQQKNMHSKPPRPATKYKKSQNTIIDQLYESKNTRNSMGTPKSRSSVNRSLKQISIDYNSGKVNTPNWQSSANSGRKYYR